MKSPLKKLISVFFEKGGQRVKPLMYAQFTLFIIAIFSGLLARNNIGNMNYWSYSVIMDLMIGTGVILIGIENYIVNKKNPKHYLIWFICAIIFYWLAVDNYFLN